MDTAGKAVLLSAATVLVSLSAVMLVPSPSFRSMAGGIMLSVVFVLAAPVLGLTTAMPPITMLPEDASARVGYDVVQDAFGPGAPGTLQVVADATDAEATSAVLAEDPGIAGALPPQPATDGSGLELVSAVPTVDPSDPALAETVDRLRADLPDSALVGSAAVENLDLKTQLDGSTPLVIAVVLTCKTCHKTTWLGCGQHVDRVLADVPAAQRFPGHPDEDRRGPLARLLARLH
ncbi:hypothetical protein [Nocardioides litoris]|uniref:hypothetical protein n=1 Tax=Nocardioides litoris TaxID=1926648 RepID=UPI001FE600F9|nr:hypothetical protein [Nocardioides litoris]